MFAITEVSVLLGHHLSWGGVGRSLIVLALIWWAWSAFVWAANAHDPSSPTLQVGLLLGLVLIFVAGLAVPHAYDDEGTLFACTYAGVRFLHLGLYADASRRGQAAWSAIAGFAGTVTAGMALLIAGSFLDTTWRTALWAAAVAIDYAGPAWLTRERLRGLQQVAVAHFAERYGLFVIICLGESIISISQMDLGDIQGNIVKAYGRFGFPVARHVFYNINSAEVGRQFVTDITPLVTTSYPWTDPSTIPPVAMNIAFTYEGLRHLDVPEETLHGFSDEFSMGMKARRDIVGDTGPNHYSRWDPMWNLEERGEAQHVHMLVSINAKTEDFIEERYLQLQQILARAIAKFPEVPPPGVTQLTGHRGPGGALLDYQPSAALVDRWDKEHFGYSDGISGTFFRECGEDPRLVIGGGKPNGKDPRTPEGWEPLEPGEFILGHSDEVRSLPGGARPAAVLEEWHVPRVPQAASERRLVQLVSGAGRRSLSRRERGARREVRRTLAQRRAPHAVSDRSGGRSVRQRGGRAAGARAWQDGDTRGTRAAG